MSKEEEEVYASREEEAGGRERPRVPLNFWRNDLLGPVTRVEKKKKTGCKPLEPPKRKRRRWRASTGSRHDLGCDFTGDST